MRRLDANSLSCLIDHLREQGYLPVGPVLRDGAIVYDTLASADDLPRGWTERQAPGRYRVERRGDDAWFGFTVGPDSWKKFLYPVEQRLWRATRGRNGFEVEEDRGPKPRYAFLGIRPCELEALDVLDRVLLAGPYIDRGYASRRAEAFLVAVQCAEPGGQCFCASMGTGPRAAEGFDLALTEVLEDDRHYFVCEVGSDRAREVLDALNAPEATQEERARSSRVSESAVAGIGRSLETGGLKEILQGNPEHPHWQVVAERCLACANCTLVCPTCFCSTVEDRIDLPGNSAERERRWDSCFTDDFSYIAGGHVRVSVRSRYRQWLTHKLASWVDQFGRLGCVGCGRCITWCPACIDITEEARALRAGVASSASPEGERVHENS